MLLLLLGLPLFGQSSFIKQYSPMPQQGLKKFVSEQLHGNKVFSTFSYGDSGLVLIGYDGQGNEKLNVALIDSKILEPQGIATYNNTIIIAGRIKKINNHDAIFVIKTDTLGQVIWYKTFANNDELLPRNVAIDDNGNIVVIGSYNPWEYTGQPHKAFFLLLDKNGNQIIYKAVKTGKNYPSLDGAVKINNGGFILSGQTGHAWDFFSALTLKISATGNIDWLKSYRMELPGGNYNLWSAGTRSTISIINAIQANKDQFLLTGYCSDHSQYGTNETFFDGFAMLIDEQGNVLGNKRYKGSGRTSFYDAKRFADGNIGIAGTTNSGKTGCFMQLDSTTKLLSNIGYTTSTSGNTYFYGQNKTATGQFLLTGMSQAGSNIMPTTVMMDFNNPGCSNATVSFPEQTLTINSLSQTYSLEDAVQETNRTLTSSCFCNSSSYICGKNDVYGEASAVFTTKAIPCLATIVYANYDKSKLICPASFFLVAGSDTSWADSIVVTQDNTVVTAHQKSGVCVAKLKDTVIKEANAATSVNLGPDKEYCGPMPTVMLDAQVTGFSYQWSTGDTTQKININTPGIYSIKASKGGCVIGDTITIDQIMIPKSFGPDETHCANEKITLRAAKKGAGIVNTWSTGETADSIVVTKAGVYILETTENGCKQNDTIQFFYLDELELEADTTIHCHIFTPITIGNKLPIGQKYYWNTGDTTRTIVAYDTGIYKLRLVAANCEATELVKIDFTPLTLSLGNDTGICINDSVNFILDAQHPGYDYLWSTKDTTQTITVNNIGKYWGSISKGICTTADTITVSNIGKYNLLDIKTCDVRPTELDAGNAGAYYMWSTGQTTQTIQFPGSGEYWVEISLNNCVFYDSIKIADGPDDFYMYIPSAFTPNHDSRNDYFSIKSNGLQHFYLQVFDRWGEFLFSSKDPSFVWNGTYKGEALPGGTYYYTVNYLYFCGHKQPQIVGYIYIME
jgi:gliding motility-associated-like protein